MKNHLVILLLLMSFYSKAQDKIFKNDGMEILAKVLEINLIEIKYKKFEYLDGPTIILAKREINKILYENGTSESFEIENQFIHQKTDSTKFISSDHFRLLGASDAKLFYSGRKSGVGGTFITSLVSPILGLIPAITCSAIYPNEVNLNYPNEDLMKNKDYRISYLKEAKKIKQKKIWGVWGGTTAISIIITLVSRNNNSFNY